MAEEGGFVEVVFFDEVVDLVAGLTGGDCFEMMLFEVDFVDT